MNKLGSTIHFTQNQNKLQEQNTHRIDPPSAHEAGEGDRVGGVLSAFQENDQNKRLPKMKSDRSNTA